MSEHEHGHAEHGHEHSPDGGCCGHDHGHAESGGCCDHGHEESGGEHGHGHGHGHEEKNLTGDDICGDGGVLKTILVEGDATQGTPPPGSKVTVHYVGKLLTGTKKAFASSFHTGSQPFRFVLGSDDVLAAWNQGLDGMCEGERRRLLVPWQMGYGEKGSKGVPPYSDLQYDFELVELSLSKVGKKKGKSEL